MRLRIASAGWFLVLGASTAGGQEVSAERLVIDSVDIRTENVFSDSAAEGRWVYRTANSLRFRTRDNVVRRELLFRAGDSIDGPELAESERLLRDLELFRRISVDTVRAGDRLVAEVRTQDAWSTLPIFSGRFASDGTLTGRVGVTERNLLGTGNLVSFAYRRSTERDGLELDSRWRRLLDSQVDVGAQYALLSDGSFSNWLVGDPWRSFEDRFRLEVGGGAADGRRLQYRVESPTRSDTTLYRHHYYAQAATVGFAPVATWDEVVRIEFTASIRNERLLPDAAPEPESIPDSIFGDVGAFVTYERPAFDVVQYLDGLNQQDIDLTTGATIGARLAPGSFGYQRTGFGPVLGARLGLRRGRLLLRAALAANGLFTSAGLDSGRVVASVTAGALLGGLNVTLVRVQGGVLDGAPPGREFALGFDAPPRSFEPYSFVGTRALWGTVEHRWYALPTLFEHFGAAFAAYFDFGGAWYRDQDPRWGAEVGVGLRTSSRLGPRADTNRIDLGYRLGRHFAGNRFVVSVGTGLAFF